MIASIDRKRVLPSFLRGAEYEFKSALGVRKITERGMVRRFRLQGLFDAMYDSLHFAEWRAVGIEARPPVRTVREHIGFDITLGTDIGDRVEMRYFPEVRNRRDKSYPLEIASLKLAHYVNNREDEVSLHNVPAILTRSSVHHRTILFEGKIPFNKKEYKVIRIFPISDASDGYSFRLE